VSGDKQRPARYRLTFALDIPADLIAVQEVDPAALDAAQAIIDDLAHGRVRGKLLGERRVSGDLTGLARVKFDTSSRRPQRFRLIYRQVDKRTRHVVAIGFRDEHAIYRTAVRRVAQA
jgi:hypothetical protein